MKNKIFLGFIIGILAGIIDIIPMILMNIGLDAVLSAFSFWVLVSIFTFNFDIKIKGALKGIIFAYLLIIPSAFIIGWGNFMHLMPIIIMNIILGSVIGLLDKKINYKS